MSKVLIIYHSRTGNTEEMAKAVAEGASSVTGTEVIIKRASDATLDDLLSCDMVAFGSPTNFSYMAGALKEFFDRTYYPSQGKLDGKPYTAFVSCASRETGEKALYSIKWICGGFKLKKAVEGIVNTGKPSLEVLTQCRELGNKLAAAPTP